MTRVNEAIREREVLVIGAEGEKLGIRSIEDAIALAKDAGLDLVEVSPGASPAVCRIQNYGKVRYEAQKKKMANKKKQKHQATKMITMRPVTDVGDYNTKVRNITKFLSKGDKVRVVIRFRGREMMHTDIGFDMMAKLQQDIAEVGVAESKPSMDGRQMQMMVVPVKK